MGGCGDDHEATVDIAAIHQLKDTLPDGITYTALPRRVVDHQFLDQQYRGMTDGTEVHPARCKAEAFPAALFRQLLGSITETIELTSSTTKTQIVVAEYPSDSAGPPPIRDNCDHLTFHNGDISGITTPASATASDAAYAPPEIVNTPLIGLRTVSYEKDQFILDSYVYNLRLDERHEITMIVTPAPSQTLPATVNPTQALDLMRKAVHLVRR